MTRFVTVAYIAGVLLAASPTLAQEFDLYWHTFDGGGGASSSGAFMLTGTIGQPDAGVVMTGGSFSLTGGFWAVGSGSPCGVNCTGDLDRTCDVSLQDLAILLAHFGTPGGATPDQGDLDGNSDVSLQDLAILLANFGNTCP